MNKKLSSVLMLCAAAFVVLPLGRLLAKDSDSTPDASPATTWSTSYAEALTTAKAENRRILIDFSGSDWCHWCKVMDEEVLSKQAFKDYADKHLVLLLADTPRKSLPEELTRQNDALKRRFHIDGFPTFLVLDSEGNELDRRSGYVRGGPSNFISFLKVTEYAESPSASQEKPE